MYFNRHNILIIMVTIYYSGTRSTAGFPTQGKTPWCLVGNGGMDVED